MGNKDNLDLILVLEFRRTRAGFEAILSVIMLTLDEIGGLLGFILYSKLENTLGIYIFEYEMCGLMSCVIWSLMDPWINYRRRTNGAYNLVNIAEYAQTKNTYQKS